jgi:hypothetical protein
MPVLLQVRGSSHEREMERERRAGGGGEEREGGLEGGEAKASLVLELFKLFCASVE